MISEGSPVAASAMKSSHQVDVFPTLIRIVGAKLPEYRIIDGIDQSDFLIGKKEKSNREGFPCYVGDVLHAVKWGNWKVHFVWQEYMFDAPQPLTNTRRVFNLIGWRTRSKRGGRNKTVISTANVLSTQKTRMFDKHTVAWLQGRSKLKNTRVSVGANDCAIMIVLGSAR
jgi:hypothetical protein